MMSEYKIRKVDSLIEMVLKILLNAKYSRLAQIRDDLYGYFSQKRIFFEIEQLQVQLSMSKYYRTNKMANKKYIARE